MQMLKLGALSMDTINAMLGIHVGCSSNASQKNIEKVGEVESKVYKQVMTINLEEEIQQTRESNEKQILLVALDSYVRWLSLHGIIAYVG